MDFTISWFLFDLILYVPVNNLSVMLGPVFLGWTSMKLGLMCLAQGHNAVMLVRLKPTAHWVNNILFDSIKCLLAWFIVHSKIPKGECQIIMYNVFLWLRYVFSFTNSKTPDEMPWKAKDHRKNVKLWCMFAAEVCFYLGKLWGSWWKAAKVAFNKCLHCLGDFPLFKMG